MENPNRQDTKSPWEKATKQKWPFGTLIGVNDRAAQGETSLLRGGYLRQRIDWIDDVHLQRACESERNLVPSYGIGPTRNVTFQLTPNSVAGTLSHPHIDSTNP